MVECVGIGLGMRSGRREVLKKRSGEEMLKERSGEEMLKERSGEEMLKERSGGGDVEGEVWGRRC